MSVFNTNWSIRREKHCLTLKKCVFFIWYLNIIEKKGEMINKMEKSHALENNLNLFISFTNFTATT